MRNTGRLQVLGSLGLLAAGLLVAGCKSAPELTATQAQALIQASYDQTAPVGTAIVVNDLGMRQGVTAISAKIRIRPAVFSSCLVRRGTR
jgi:uncharacterized lipoprotein YajG